jgi:AraC-like DNA-binding protein
LLILSAAVLTSMPVWHHRLERTLMEGLVSVRVAAAPLATLGQGSALARHVIEALELDPSTLSDPDHWLPLDVWLELWNEVERRTSDACLGLHTAEALSWGHFGVIDYVAATCDDLRSAFAVFARYFRILNTATDIVLADEGELFSIERRMQGDEVPRASRHAAEFSLGCITLRFRFAAFRDWVPHHIELRYPPPSAPSEYERVFGCEVRFGSPRDAIVVDQAVLSVSMKSPDPGLKDLIEHHARDLLARLPLGRSLVDDVRGVLGRELAGGDPSIDGVASRLGIARRSLQRRLAEAGTSFTTVLEEMRERLARSYLLNRDLSIAEVAFLLGYSETPTFHRAFRRWTGLTPGSYRERQRRQS